MEGVRRFCLLLAALASAANATACGGERAQLRDAQRASPNATDSRDARRAAPPASTLDGQDVRAVPIGRSPRFRPAAARRDGAPVAGLRCTSRRARFGVHLELFAAGRVVVVPAGIGVAGPVRRDGAYVRGGSCRYAASTMEPTGVVEIVHGTSATLGDLFAVWGQPLSPTQLASFRGRVRAWVGGRRITGDPNAIKLGHHAQIVLAVGPEIPVHTAFAFRAGL